MKQILLSCILFLAISFTASAQVRNIHGDFAQLQEGDLLFYYSSKNNPITDVTDGIDGKLISHVAIFHRDSDKEYALEATHRGVVLTPKDSILKHRKDAHIIVGRLRDNSNVEQSVRYAMRYIGRPYDFYFDEGDSAIYCSELVQISYRKRDGSLIFNAIPMSFHDHSGKIIEYWKKYYAKAGRSVPEGAPGSNPGDLSQRKEVKILYQLY